MIYNIEKVSKGNDNYITKAKDKCSLQDTIDLFNEIIEKDDNDIRRLTIMENDLITFKDIIVYDGNKIIKGKRFIKGVTNEKEKNKD